MKNCSALSFVFVFFILFRLVSSATIWKIIYAAKKDWRADGLTDKISFDWVFNEWIEWQHLAATDHNGKTYGIVRLENSSRENVGCQMARLTFAYSLQVPATSDCWSVLLWQINFHFCEKRGVCLWWNFPCHLYSRRYIFSYEISARNINNKLEFITYLSYWGYF